jgi:hypothetical protein
MKDKANFLALLSQKMGWDYQLTPTYCRFDGYRTWRKQYNSDLESVLFSTGKILEFDELEFKNWLNKLPSQARFRVKNRVTYSVKDKGSMDLKWPVLNKWFVEWEQYKASMQEEQRKLEEKVRQGIASLEDQEKYVVDTLAFDEILAGLVKTNEEWSKYVEMYNPMPVDEVKGMLSTIDFDCRRYK